MAERPIGDSAQDLGDTIDFAGTVGTSPTAFPASPGNPITFFLVVCPDQLNTRRLYWSLDDVTYHELTPGGYIGFPPKGNKTQIYLKGNAASVNYELIMNREPT